MKLKAYNFATEDDWVSCLLNAVKTAPAGQRD